MRYATAAEIVEHSFSNDWAIRMQERADLAEAVFVAADYFGVHFSEFRGLDGGDPDLYAWNFTAEVLMAMGLDTPQKINAASRVLADARWAEAKKREAERDLAESEFQFHVSGWDAKGAELMDTGFCSDMGLYASMDTIEEADAWAERQFATDSRVHYVNVTIYRRSPSSVGWRFHKGVKTIHRPAAV